MKLPAVPADTFTRKVSMETDHAYELIKHWCTECKRHTMHEHGVKFKDMKLVEEFFTCIRCQKTERYERGKHEKP